ncbi:trichohyalin-like [Papaver somniferum]|uniref:trichohyalin-like n=1 Tax=Papaver somniferum TaxID=3469 RepID=UPI000E6FD0B9|nr:trichohyalin-like [Papaver somniferum]
MRQNNELREENIRLQERRSRSMTRSRSKSSTSRRSQSNRRDVRQQTRLDDIVNSQENDDLPDRQDEYRMDQPLIDDRYVQHGEGHRIQEDNGHNRYEQRIERQQGEKHDPELGRVILKGMQEFKDQRVREAEIEIYMAEQNHAQYERERRRRRRQEIEEREFQYAVREKNRENRIRIREVNRTLPNQIVEDEEERRRARWQETEMVRDRYNIVEEDDRERQKRRRDAKEERELQEAIRQNRHDNSVMQARLKRPVRQDLDQTMSEEILKEMEELREMMTIFRIKESITMSELREFQEEYITLEEKQRDMESYPVAIPKENNGNASLLPRMTNVVASTSQGSQGKNITEVEKKLVAMGSADQEEFEREHKEK